MLVLDGKRPTDNKFDNNLRGYSGAYCYYDDLSRWAKATLYSNSFFGRLFFYCFL